MRGASGAGRHVYLLGHNISYSASPAMQNAAFAAVGLDWVYELLDIPPSELPTAVRKLRAEDTGGAHVTNPHKLTEMDHLDDIDPEHQREPADTTNSKQQHRHAASDT